MGQVQSLEELISLLLRRRWLIVAVTVIGTLLAIVYAKSRPDTFETAAVIQVEAPAVRGNDADTSRTSAAAQTLQVIEQRLTTRENLTAVIDRHGIYADLPLSTDKKIDLLRQAISFQGVDSAAGQTYGQPRVISAIIVTARMSDPELAARVANDFAQGILDQSALGQRAQADQNVAFFTEEVNRISQLIAGLEGEIADYKNANAASLPALRDAKRDELVSLDTDLRRLQQDKLALVGEAAQIKAKETMRETDRRALEAVEAQMAVLDDQIGSIQTRRAELEAALSTSPEVERVLAGYDRQLEQLQTQFDVTTTRMAQAETDARLAERQQAERFSLLERAIVPEGAMGGGGKKIVIAGALGSLIAAFGLAFVLDLLNPVVRTAAQMERQLDLRPVVSIPEVTPEAAGKAAGGHLKLLDDPTKPLLGLPRFAVVSAGITLVLLVAAAVV